MVRKMLPSIVPMDADAGASRRSAVGACLEVSSAPLLSRGITGRWPDVLNGHAHPDSTREAGADDRTGLWAESQRLGAACEMAQRTE